MCQSCVGYLATHRVPQPLLRFQGRGLASESVERVLGCLVLGELWVTSGRIAEWVLEVLSKC